MTPYRLPGGRMLAVACVLVGAGLSQAAAQFPPPPGQTAPAQTAAGSPFPPPPGQSQAPAQDSAFPPPPGQGSRPTSITVGPSSGGFPPAGGGGGFGPPGGGSFAPPGGSGGFSGPAPQPTEAQKVCLNFPSIREDVEKSAAVIKAASARKASREEVCPIFKTFAVKEAKMISFLETNMKLCGVPPQIIPNMKKNHAQTIRIRDTVCSPAPAGPGAPTLSDALGGPIIADDQSAKLPGRGTFDTLTGNALQR